LRKIQTVGYGAEKHRISYEIFVGKIPEGMVIDHLCRTPACVNPKHLEPVTIAENTFRGTGMCARNHHKTHCKRGHSLSGENVIVREVVRRRRICVTCDSYRKKYGCYPTGKPITEEQLKSEDVREV
jgi:hypothetical protein